MLLFDFVVLRSPVENLNNVFPTPQKLQPIFKEGLFLASRDFYKQLEKIDYLSEDEKAKVKASLLKYWVRASIRCTPFGTFAGTAILYLAENPTEIVLNKARYHNRKIRLDMGYISFLVSELEKIPIIQDQILLFINNSIYQTPLDLRYSETITVNHQKDYKLASVQKSDYLAFVLNKAEKGISIKELSNSLALFAEVEFEEAKQFVTELWGSNLLVSNLEPCVTGPEPFENLLSVIKDYVGIDALKIQLTDLLNHLLNPKEGTNHYIEAEALIRQLFPPSGNLKNFIQTDLFLSCDKRDINSGGIASIVHQMEDLTFMSRTRQNTDLNAFKKRFTERYGNKITPLAIALDADIGIGYAGIDDISGGNPLIDDIGYRSNELGSNIIDNIHDFTFAKYFEYANGDREYIEITEQEIKGFKANSKNNQFPNSMFIHGALMKKEGVLNKENFTFHLMSFGGPSAGNLLGRFTQGNEELLNLTRTALLKEEQENPDIIFAEIVHLPQARIGNVLLRPLLRHYEIPYVGKSGASKEDQLPISDLFLCIRHEEIILLSKKYNKRVIPRLTTAHNFHYGSLPIYKFLCDLQHQNFSIGAIWDWGQLDRLKYLPRVIYKDVILKKARWKIELLEISDLPNETINYTSYFTKFNLKRKIPQRVLLVELDNQMLIDFEQPDSILMFLTYLKKYKSVVLEEFLFNVENCIVKDENGQSHTNEIIIPIHNTGDFVQKLKVYNLNNVIVDEKYPPGSEWLYFKVFCSTNSIDKILVQHVLPYIELNKEKQLFDKFFFIRYKEQGNHLRIRFQNKDAAKRNDILLSFTALLRPLLEDDIIQSIAIDTYLPETERYGGPDMLAISEAMFDVDSLATLKILNLLESDVQDNYRILILMRSVDAFLTDFKFSVDEKRELFKTLSLGFASEFGGGSTLQKNINSKYKNISRSVFSFMDSERDSDNEMLEVAEIINSRSTEYKSHVLAILEIIERQGTNISLDELLKSHIHMMANRLFIAHQRKYELVIYNFLERYYTSVISINSRDQQPKSSSAYL